MKWEEYHTRGNDLQGMADAYLAQRNEALDLLVSTRQWVPRRCATGEATTALIDRLKVEEPKTCREDVEARIGGNSTDWRELIRSVADRIDKLST